MNRVEQLVEEHGSALAEDARSLLAENPDVEAVGMILEAGVPEAASFLAALAEQAGQTTTPQGFLGLVPRSIAVEMLKASTPRALEWLESSTADQLPIVVMLKDGTQLVTIPL